MRRRRTRSAPHLLCAAHSCWTGQKWPEAKADSCFVDPRVGSPPPIYLFIAIFCLSRPAMEHLKPIPPAWTGERDVYLSVLTSHHWIMYEFNLNCTDLTGKTGDVSVLPRRLFFLPDWVSLAPKEHWFQIIFKALTFAMNSEKRQVFASCFLVILYWFRGVSGRRKWAIFCAKRVQHDSWPYVHHLTVKSRGGINGLISDVTV